ncbi:MAG: YcgN family cysteine cluster protein [Rhodospirillales bacterium]|nr:YcgN family cysteine cluster protein [Rhodospirillales bacterium]
MADKPFWKTKALSEMSQAEWESLCDGCGKCCLHKIEDIATGKISYTNIACRLLDSDACKCSDYANRSKRVHDCVKLTADNLASLKWMPSTCAYRLVADGKDLEWWHPLVSGDRETIHAAGMSVRGRTIPEKRGQDLWKYRVKWPV